MTLAPAKSVFRQKELFVRLNELARTPQLLVATDYDGTIAPIVEDPPRAFPRRETVVALEQLAAQPATHVAVISGRALHELARLLGQPNHIHLVGSHGSEFDIGFADELPAAARALHGRLHDELAAIASDFPGAQLELKPASISLHYRQLRDGDTSRILALVEGGPGRREGVFTQHGKKVIELSVVPTSKGEAIHRIRQRVGATATLFIGDDVTDERAFETLGGPDVGVKVGEGETLAAFRVQDNAEVAQLLAHLAERREAWMAGPAQVPLTSLAFLSDQRTAALVTPEARVVWMCLPRLDSPALFAELLGGSACGYFHIRPANPRGLPRQRYVDGTLILVTEWDDMRITDFLDCSRGRAVQRAGRTDFIRIVEGRGQAIIEFAPRLDFGRAPTTMVVQPGGLALLDTHDPIILRSPPVNWDVRREGPHDTARAIIDLDGGPFLFSLCYGTANTTPPSGATYDTAERLTAHHWRQWAERLELPAVARSLVRSSALVLKGLCYGPTGAIAAAATTSLPEHLGGVRNWDYRFCWIRDAALAAGSLVKLGSDEEAMRLLDWLLSVLRESAPERIHPLYALTGEALGPEAEISELPGYARSRPVRVGNAAARQVQLDVFGPVVELMRLLIERDAPLSSEHWRLVVAIVDAVARRWHEPDHGIWEVRTSPQHHIHSKVMCWLSVDRAIAIAQRFQNDVSSDWVTLRQAIADDILTRGYHKSLHSFTSHYDTDATDAAALWVGLSGLLAPQDPRFVNTVAAVERELLDGPVVYRYRYDDGLPGKEGGFHLCTAWLIASYVLLGRQQEAIQLFRQMCATTGPLGLLSEQHDPAADVALGNHPQAYSHVGIIESALLLDATQR